MTRYDGEGGSSGTCQGREEQTAAAQAEYKSKLFKKGKSKGEEA